jgi:hypothetical protein
MWAKLNFALLVSGGNFTGKIITNQFVSGKWQE